MKKLILSLLMLVIGGALSTTSADTETTDEKKTDAIEELTKSMAKQYDLNEEQTKALQLLNAKRAKDLAEVDSACDIKTANAAQKAEIKKIKTEIQTNYDTMLKDLFSEKQYQKYQEYMDSQKEQLNGGVNWMANVAMRMSGSNYVNLVGWTSNTSDSLTIAKNETKKMVRKYKLDKEQEEKVLALNIAEVSAEIAERRNVSLDNVKATEMAEMSQNFIAMAKRRTSNYERYLKEILDEKQYKKYTNAKKLQQSRSSRFGGFIGPPM